MRIQGLEIGDVGEGTVIPNWKLEDAWGLSAITSEFKMKATAFAKALERQLRQDGPHRTVRVLSDGVHVLTNTAASVFNESFYESGYRRMRLAHRRLRAVDVARLPEEMRDDHRRTKDIQAIVLDTIKRIRKVAATEGRPAHAATPLG